MKLRLFQSEHGDCILLQGDDVNILCDGGMGRSMRNHVRRPLVDLVADNADPDEAVDDVSSTVGDLSHPIHLIYHVIYQGPGAAMTHTGYEDLLIKDKRSLALGTFYHTLHHRYFECNYGNQEMPWDRWFGTFHDGTEEGTAATRARKKRMYS